MVDDAEVPAQGIRPDATTAPHIHSIDHRFRCGFIHTYTHTEGITSTLDATMIAATRSWLRAHRKKLAIGAGVIGAGYVAGQYVLGKISEARQRMGEDRIAKEK